MFTIKSTGFEKVEEKKKRIKQSNITDNKKVSLLTILALYTIKRSYDQDRNVKKLEVFYRLPTITLAAVSYDILPVIVFKIW